MKVSNQENISWNEHCHGYHQFTGCVRLLVKWIILSAFGFMPSIRLDALNKFANIDNLLTIKKTPDTLADNKKTPD